MSGVENRSRLEQLLALHNRTRQEIAAALRRDDRHELGRLQDLLSRVEAAIVAAGGTVPAVPKQPRGLPRTRRQKADVRKDRRLAELGITAKDVKVWAVSQGLLAAVRQGRVKAELIEAYATAHATQEGGAA